MDITTWAGILLGASVLFYGLHEAGGIRLFLNIHGIILVLGGTLGATLINTPFKRILSAVQAAFKMFLSDKTPSPEDTIREIIRLREVSRVQGGLFALQKEAGEFGDGSIQRAIDIAVTLGETNAVRDQMEMEIKNRRTRHNEEANVFRTVSVLGPMFGLLGTLLGIVQVLRNISDPSRVGPAMAVALSTAFYGIALANMICVPMAGKIRNRAFEESLMLEIITHGVVGILENKPAYLLEMELQSFAEQKKREKKD